MYAVLGLKLTLVPVLILGITTAGRLWGPSVAGWLSGFPVVGGPILFFIALEQGRTFGATAAAATLLGIFAHLAFGVTYAWMATRWQWQRSLAAALLIYALAVLALNQISLSVWQTIAAIGCVLLIAKRFYPHALPDSSPRAQISNRGELFIRMAAGAALVTVVTLTARDLGPRLSGLLAMFPVLGVVLAVFSHRNIGAHFTITLLRTMVLGYCSFMAFCAVLALALLRIDLAASFFVATLAAIVVQVATLRLLPHPH